MENFGKIDIVHNIIMHDSYVIQKENCYICTSLKWLNRRRESLSMNMNVKFITVENLLEIIVDIIVGSW